MKIKILTTVLLLGASLGARASTTSAVQLESLPPVDDMSFGALHFKAGATQLNRLQISNQTYSFRYPGEISGPQFEVAWSSPSLTLLGEWSLTGAVGYARFATTSVADGLSESGVSLHTIPVSVSLGYEARFAAFMDWFLPGAGLGVSLVPYVQNGISDGLSARGWGASGFWFVGARHHLKKWLGIRASLFGEYRRTYSLMGVGSPDFSGQTILVGLSVPL